MNICNKTNKDACPTCQECSGNVWYIKVLQEELEDYAETVSKLNNEVKELQRKLKIKGEKCQKR